MSVTAVFVGMPGSGKSTVGRLVASYLDVPFADTDNLIEAEAGMPIPQIFAERGESGFRDLEADVVATALTERSGVLSLGGGAVIRPETRQALKAHRVVLIDVDRDILLGRLLRSTNDRPLMRGDAEAKLDTLFAEREPLYREVATHVVSSDHSEARRVARRVLEVLDAWRNTRVEADGFDAIVGTGLAFEACVAAQRATSLVLLRPADSAVPAEYRQALASEHELVEVPFDPAKPAEEAARIRAVLEKAEVPRSAAALVFGDWAAQRIGAFATRMHHGGLSVIAVPTTIEAALCGAWRAALPASHSWLAYEPSEILCDLALFDPDTDNAAEALSLGLACDAELAELAAAPLTRESLEGILVAGLAARARGVHGRQRGEDFMYGHTAASAIEALPGGGLSHSQGLALGMLLADALAEDAAIAPPGQLAAHRQALEAAGVAPPGQAPGRRQLKDAIIAQARASAPDAKMQRHCARFLVLGEGGSRQVLNCSEASALDRALGAIGL